MIGQLGELRLGPDQQVQRFFGRRGQTNRTCCRSTSHCHHACRMNGHDGEGVGHEVCQRDSAERQLYIYIYYAQSLSNARKMQILAVGTRSPPDRSKRGHSTSETRSIGVRYGDDGSNESSEDCQEQGEFHLYCEGVKRRSRPKWGKVGNS